MRNSIRLALACALAVAVGSWSQAARADVFVKAMFTKDKTITETITETINKYIEINSTYDNTPEGAAEADALVNQRNENNVVDGYPGYELSPLYMDIELDALITNSITDNTGIVGVNQDVGNNVNQENSVALAITDAASSVTDSHAAADQRNTGNYSNQVEALTDLQGNPYDDMEGIDPNDITPATTDPDKTAIITDSVNTNSGIVGVNQNAGNNNNQANAVANAVGFSSHVALSEAALGQVNCGNVIVAVETYHKDAITNSVNGNSGIVGVNQTTGNNNNQASVISFSALSTPVDVSIPGTLPGGA